MFLRWTVIAAVRGGAGVDVAVDAPSGTTWPQVRDRVLQAAGCEGRSATVAGVELADHHVVGRFPLLDGAEVAVSPAQWASRSSATGPDIARPTSAPVALVAVSGPDAGRELQLRPGRLVLGRGERCDLVVGDPDISRRHCQVELSAAGVLVRDLSSTNGTLVTAPRDPSIGQPAGAWAPKGDTGMAVALGGHITVGSSRLQVRLHRTSDTGTAGADRDDGTVVHAPGPRPVLSETPQVYAVPALPTIASKRRIPWLAATLPLLVSIPIALWWGSPIFLLMGIAGPLIIIGSVLGDRRESRRNHAAAVAEHDQAMAAARATAARSAADILAARLHTHPDVASVLDVAVHREASLWARARHDPDALLTRVGVADLVAPVRVDIADPSATGRLRSERIVMSNAPVTVDLTIGVAIQGPGPWRAGVTRGIVGRVAATLGPEHVRIVVIVGTRQAAHRWRWTRWLPHTDAGPVSAGTPASVERALAQLCEVAPAGRGNARLVLVVVDDIPHSAVSRLCALADSASSDDSPLALLVSAALDSGVPQNCRIRLLPHGESGTGLAVQTPEGTQTGVADLVGEWWAHRLSRALAPVRPAVVASSAGLPDSVSLISLLRGIDSTGPGQLPGSAPVRAAEIAAWWRRAEQAREPVVSVPLAAGAGGAVVVDLVHDGPHALIAGTTGAGKSELLRSLVLGLACRNPPSEVAFLLVDFKGGATLGDCARLPHSLGLLTDLDIYEARRVLAGLRAEIRRRERILAAAGVADLLAYRRLRRTEPLPRFVCVVDEFRVLAEHAPDVLDALVHVATVGRSLGVHLILATQRPSGVISADIRANTALRIALRVQDAADSRDVIDRPDASELPRNRPGRAIISRDGAVETVQTAHAGGSHRSAQGRLRVWLQSAVDADSHAETAAQTSESTGVAAGVHQDAPGSRGGSEEESGADHGDDGVGAFIEACRSAAATTPVPALQPWLPALPPVVSRQAVVDAAHASTALAPGVRGSSAADAAEPAATEQAGTRGPVLPFALADLPDEQRREGLCWTPGADGPLLVLGGPGSGRSTAVSVLIEGGIDIGLPVVVMTGQPEDPWPPGSVVVDWRDADHLVDVLTRLGGRAGAGREDWMVVGIDDCDALLQSYSDHADILELLTTLSRDAVAARLALVLAGGRGVGTARMGTGGRMRVLLRPADPFDASLVGASPRDLPVTWPPGRGVMTGGEVATGAGIGVGHAGGPHARSAVEIQVISPQSSGVHADGNAIEPWPRDLPVPLPRIVPAAGLPAPSWPKLSLGLVGPDALPVSVDVLARPGTVVAGPPGSGRTAALRLLATAAARCQAVVVVLTPRVDEWTDLAVGPPLPDATVTPPLADLNGTPQDVGAAPNSPGTGAGVEQPQPGSIIVACDAVAARAALARGGRRLLVIDDIDVGVPEIDDLAAAVAHAMVPGTGTGASPAAGADLGLVVASTAAHLGGQFRGFAAEVRRHGSAVLLRPGRHDARDVLSATAPAQAATVPGRGVMISRGRGQRIQVACGE